MLYFIEGGRLGVMEYPPKRKGIFAFYRPQPQFLNYFLVSSVNKYVCYIKQFHNRFVWFEGWGDHPFLPLPLTGSTTVLVSTE